MNKIKKYIITFCLILSTLFINITGVYCISVDTSYLDSSVFEYNLFNYNLKPLFVDLDTGQGIYYAGYVPEFQFNTLSQDNSISVDSSYLEQQLQSDDLIDIYFNTVKTQFYYYDGEKYIIYPNGSLFAGNQCLRIQEFLGIMGISTFTSSSENISIYSYMQENNYIFDNYVITYNTTSYRDSISYGISYLTIDSITSYPQNVADLQVCVCAYKSIYSNHNYSNDYYVANFEIMITDSNQDNVYNNYDSIKLHFNNLSDVDVETLYCFDFANVSLGSYDRVYYTYSELLDIFGSECFENFESMTLDINSIKTLSNLYVADQQEDIYIYGLGVCFVEAGLSDYSNFLNNQDILYSNMVYTSFQYDTSISTSIPVNHRIYKLSNNYQTFTLVIDGAMQDSEYQDITGALIGIDGTDTGRHTSSSDSDGSRNDGSSIDFSGDITDLITSTVKMFNRLYTFCDDIANMAEKLFSFLPSEILNLIYLSVEFCLLLGIIKFVSGVL